MDIEGDSGPFSHWHCGVFGHTGKVTTTVGVGRRNGQVAPGCHSLPVWEHFLICKEIWVVGVTVKWPMNNVDGVEHRWQGKTKEKQH